jgi:hypothetical protein
VKPNVKLFGHKGYFRRKNHFDLPFLSTTTTKKNINRITKQLKSNFFMS